MAQRQQSPALAAHGWGEERLEAQALGDDVLGKRVPPHVNLFYCLGGLALAALSAQFASGTALTLLYRPAAAGPFPAGGAGRAWVARGWHRASSSPTLLPLALHAARALLSGGHLRPRELAWASGLAAAFLASAFGVSGYALPWDQTGFWAYQVVSAPPGVLGAAGGALVDALRGGGALGQAGLARCFAAHALSLPALLVGALTSHPAGVRKQGISGPL